MHNYEDLNANTKMSFEQIIGICDLILEAENLRLTSILTIRDIAENALKRFE